MGFIYKITSPSGKCYIGSTTNIKRRFTEYKRLKCEKQYKLIHSFLKYGVDSHTFEILEECENCSMRKLEGFYGLQFNSLHPNGLNLSLPKIDEVYTGLSNETKQKIGDKNRGRKHTEEQNKRNSETKKGNKNMLGKKHSPESIQKMRECKLGNKFCVGKKASEETKLKQSLAKKGKPGVRTGIKQSPETVKRMSQITKAWWENKRGQIKLWD